VRDEVLARQLARARLGGWAILADGSAIAWGRRVTWVPRSWCVALAGGHGSTRTERQELLDEIVRLTA
jgi:hypothetical protein